MPRSKRGMHLVYILASIVLSIKLTQPYRKALLACRIKKIRGLRIGRQQKTLGSLIASSRVTTNCITKVAAS